ncbi:MAG: putative ATP:cob(I)alamin adenosyltransferase [Bacillales bacterium]|jgi:cob(I)alamin adenosyltransferase|nr:putative ATP:cob(I)alamin adenosyltransferase [Bacillales bacterium]
MKIYTKNGDNGMTSVIGGIVTKDDVRIEAIGIIDEINSSLGVVISHMNCKNTNFKKLLNIQNELFLVGADLADINCNKYRIQMQDILDLEKEIDILSEKYSIPEKFILPGGSVIAAQLHVTRSIVRKAERVVVSLTKESHINSVLQPYLNRLSDYLFVLAWSINIDANIEIHFFEK